MGLRVLETFGLAFDSVCSHKKEGKWFVACRHMRRRFLTGQSKVPYKDHRNESVNSELALKGVSAPVLIHGVRTVGCGSWC